MKSDPEKGIWNYAVFGKPLCHRKDGELKNTPVPCPETDAEVAFIRLEK